MGVDKECRDALKMTERSEKKLLSPTKPGRETTSKHRDNPHTENSISRRLENSLKLNKNQPSNSSPKTNSTDDRKATDEMEVYQQISRKNHFLNTQNLPSLVKICKEERINCTGRKAVVTKRLKEHFKLKILRAAGLRPPAGVRSGYDYLIVLDFEATCENTRNSEYPHEIIEFPAVLIDVQEREVVSSWRRYVRPEINPTLSNFCTSLTGITQETVDKADTFETVLQQFCDWLDQKKLGVEHAFAVVTDGPFDIARFLYLSCQHKNIPVPWWATRWMNVRKLFLNFYKEDCKEVNIMGLQGMLERLNMKFEGQPHSGLDDSRNIAKIVIRLLQDGATFRINERLDIPGSKDRRLQNVAPVAWEEASNWLQTCKKEVQTHRDKSRYQTNDKSNTQTDDKSSSQTDDKSSTQTDDKSSSPKHSLQKDEESNSQTEER